MPAVAAGCVLLGVALLLHQGAPTAASGQPRREFLYGPRQARPALHYFRRWAAPATSRHLADELVAEGPAALPPNAVLDHVLRRCPGDPPSWALRASERDAAGTRHAVLLRSAGGASSLQYVALDAGGRVLAADPEEPCLLGAPPRAAAAARRLAEREGEEAKGVSREALGTGSPWTMDGQRSALLHPTQDHLVQDCNELFSRTAFEKCSKDMSLEVVSAKLGIVDGFVVSITGRVHGEGGDKAAQKVKCDFEPRGKDVALQGLGEPADTALPEEEKGLAATLIMTVDICKSDQESSLSPEAGAAINLAQQHRMGELSLYKGYRHVYDGLPPPPHWTEELQSKFEELPESHSLLESSPGCFPDEGREVVENQGQCGSCWAFAAASSLMANICVYGESKSSLASDTDRFEISVQRILSCNPQGYGCDGGHAVAASDAFIKALLSKARDNPYLCGGGDSLAHFEEASVDCADFPWGGSDATCAEDTANTNWHFGGIYQVIGERDMAAAIAEGSALYVTFAVYEAFMYHSEGVFKSAEGDVLGAHAVVALGYGVEDGTKYWLIQNSWGTSWGQHGYVKYLKGENLGGIEDVGIYLMGWPVGETEPEPVGETVEKGAAEMMEELLYAHRYGVAICAGVLWLLFVAWRCCCLGWSSPPSKYQAASEDFPEKTAALMVSNFDGVDGASADTGDQDCGCCSRGQARSSAGKFSPLAYESVPE